MKPDKHELRRIEATLDQLNPGNSSADTETSPSVASQSALPAARSVQPFPIRQDSSAAPQPASPPRSASPHLAIGLLQQIESVVQQWQTDLHHVTHQIQALYAEGPIVDGWLEAHSPETYQTMPSLGASTLRHAEVEHLKEYVDAICSTPQPPFTDNQPRSGYRLCGLDASGQLWSRPCPPQQVPYVSLAIARYQKLRTLLVQKQSLENKLTQLVKDLTLLHSQIGDD